MTDTHGTPEKPHIGDVVRCERCDRCYEVVIQAEPCEDCGRNHKGGRLAHPRGVADMLIPWCDSCGTEQDFEDHKIGLALREHARRQGRAGN